jgi:alkane 1-monooxygenase
MNAANLIEQRPDTTRPGISRRTYAGTAYLLAFVLPLGTTAFLVSGERWVALAWVAMLGTFAWLDERLGPSREEPAPAPLQASRRYDAILYGLALLQFVHVGLLVERVGRHGLMVVESWIGIVLVGASSAYSSLVVAHELIHRAHAFPRRIGRALLVTLLYDQFYTEHLRGHHVRVGTTEDALAVRRDESFAQYLPRSWLAELRSALSIEARRLHGHGDARSLVRNAVVIGVLMEIAVMIVIIAFGGPRALLSFLVQAALAYVIISAVNYLQHWGLSRDRRKVGEADSWDCTALLSRYVLLGISLHADHHVHAAERFPRLRMRPSSPRLPHGFFVMVGLVLFQNARARRLLSEALTRAMVARTAVAVSPAGP